MSFQFDHRQLADEMEIFFLNESIGQGLPVWLPNGVVIRDELEAFIKRLEFEAGYERVASPHLGKEDLYMKSGHLKFFKEAMYPPLRDENANFYLKPMNCPHHHEIFRQGLRSYRQLPLRLAEYGQVYRYEPSGSLRGLARVRGLCQNDAHIYLASSDAADEVDRVLAMHELCYKKLGLAGYRYRLSLSDPARPQDFSGQAEDWRRAEDILRQALNRAGLEFYEAIGEAAFYGPKIDVQMAMKLGHEESIASLQLDFVSGENFDLHFIGHDGQSRRPWIIHRAPLGSHERFVALLLEYFDGQLPGWLAPIQVMLIPVSEDQREYCLKLAFDLRLEGIRARVDESQGSLAKRLRFAHKLRPFSKIVVGGMEISSGELKVQLRESELKCRFRELAKNLKEKF